MKTQLQCTGECLCSNEGRPLLLLLLLLLFVAGNSVCVFVHGFEPYFYADCPPEFTPECCAELCRVLQVRLFGGGGWVVGGLFVGGGLFLHLQAGAMVWCPDRFTPHIAALVGKGNKRGGPHCMRVSLVSRVSRRRGEQNLSWFWGWGVGALSIAENNGSGGQLCSSKCDCVACPCGLG